MNFTNDGKKTIVGCLALVGGKTQSRIHLLNIAYNNEIQSPKGGSMKGKSMIPSAEKTRSDLWRLSPL